MDLLDRLLFEESELVGERKDQVLSLIVVITDEMVGLTESDTELSAVLAHEIGHFAGRHGLRILLQDSASAIIISGLTGDLTSVIAFQGMNEREALQ